MKTYITEYDLSRPVSTIWGIEGYQQVLILIRNMGQPLDIFRLPNIDGEFALLRSKIEMEIEHRLGISPAMRYGFSRISHQKEVSELGISVIVCTRDRPELLRRCLNSLQQLNYSGHEVIVVDNASRTKETAEIVNTTNFRYVYEKRPGLDWARNRGIKEAKHSILAYVDDDVHVDKDWLKGLASGFDSPEVGAVTGLILPLELETRAQHFFEAYGDGMSKGFKAIQYAAASMSAWELIEAHRLGVGANMAYRKAALEAAGGFDTALDVGTPSGGTGDLDMFHRVLIDGWVIRYEPGALVWHQHRRDMFGLRRQLYSNGKSFGVFLIKLWMTRRIYRRKIITYVTRRWGRWLVGRVLRGCLRRHNLPLPLLWAEFWGALHAPWAYASTYRNDRKIRKLFNVKQARLR
jgi:glycosyltransferase involved in cell wall biosynthesis